MGVEATDSNASAVAAADNDDDNGTSLGNVAGKDDQLS